MSTIDKLESIKSRKNETEANENTLERHENDDEESQRQSKEIIDSKTTEYEDDEDEIYSKYSPAKKRLFVFIVALSCFLSPISSMALLPAVSVIAERFNTTGVIINVSNAVYCIVMAISPCVLGPFGYLYGRRITFILCLSLFVITTILTALSQNLAMFFIFRALCAFFGTPFFSVGATIIGDIYKPEERGTGNAWTLSGSQLGPIIGPVLGGICVTYTSWRVIFWIQVGLASFDLILSILFLPETGRNIAIVNIKKETGKTVYWVPYNPFSVILAFKYKNLILAGIISSSLHYNMYSLLTPIRYVVDPRFGLEDPVYGGLFYLAPGGGYLVGSFLGGRWADYHVRKYKKLRGRRIPEDRLRSMPFAYGVIVPGTILIYGWVLEKEKGGMAVPIIMMFIGGFGQTICFPSVNSYCVDSMPQLKGDAISGNYAIRFIAAAIGSATVLIQINHIGIGWTCTISACFLWTGSFALFLLIRYGERMRGQYDISKEPIEATLESKA
ncbi:putative transporter [Wickerhamomyces ciferrii]|uniref:Transporter n=1 Tax=Wickerhamomyces ciferrii (strain ATCC 14091 / BCRC 22168 / CBS 111 / JCM 3599 / NBRC 0793 / NRRL Y-1031 F-60-10) TaxID=1206466 RepID=K0KUL8_WICCF|nr:putative transporter [Wickerhamomyces ciferrii]CCH46881.1 putative transporter [Wickerhamomyces ciferrii]